MNQENLICEFEASFENTKTNLAFDVNDGTAYIRFVASGMEIAHVSKLLLLKGKQQTFKVSIHENASREQPSTPNRDWQESRRKAIEVLLDKQEAA